MKKRRNTLFSFCLAFFILTSSAAASLCVSANESQTPIVSPGISVIAEDNSMAMAALRGNSIKFDPDDFARALNISKVEKITVTSAPPVTDGELRVGTTVLNSGQSVNDKNLSLLSYTASTDITSSSFKFKVNDSPYEITCKLYLLDKLNHAPTLSMVPKTSLNVSTHRNITLHGTLPCYDPDGDETMIEIVSYPKSGILILTDRSSGEYMFTPSANYSGKDEFTYVARDIYGNYSASATVELTVRKPKTSIVYADMENSPSHNAALTMTEEGIMSGTQVGSATYFYPDRTVSRSEFLVMAMNALGITDVNDASATVFADDSSIPSHVKKYVAAAYDLGYIKGLYTDGKLCFEPNRAITRAEAAVMMGNMINASTPTMAPSFDDADAVPAWASASLSSLAAMGIMDTSNGNIEALSAVTRADAAEMLVNLMNTVE